LTSTNQEHNGEGPAKTVGGPVDEAAESRLRPHASEVAALETSLCLLKFAAEEPKDLPRPVVEAITMSWKAYRDGIWTPEIATTFWCNYNGLCKLIEPVKVDSIAANRKAAITSRWILWFGLDPSLSQRTAQKYTWLLAVLLVAAVVVSFFGTYYTKLIVDIKSLSAQYDTSIDQIKRTASELESSSNKATADERALISAANERKLRSISYDFADLSFKAAQILEKAKLLRYLTRFENVPRAPPTLQSPPKDSEEVYRLIQQFNAFRGEVNQLQENASVYASIVASALLPIILGTMGACAYVVRLISEQIKDTTFTATSPIRHKVRVALGALAGVVIGFGGIVSDAGISSAALSFIAGYAIEPVFATVDGIAEKFRR
jgi:uncharacterized membrane protein